MEQDQLPRLADNDNEPPEHIGFVRNVGIHVMIYFWVCVWFIAMCIVVPFVLIALIPSRFISSVACFVGVHAAVIAEYAKERTFLDHYLEDDDAD